jgi:large subunit ribosomal protein L32e
MDELIKEKQIIKKKTPSFLRSGDKKKRLKNTGWRRPKGITNKMRLQKKGHRAIVKTGYGTPKELRGIGKDGKPAVLVSNVEDLKKVGKTDKAIISSQVGLRKKIQIIEEAKKQKITITNVNDAKITKKLEAIKSKRQEQMSKKEQRSKKKEDAESKKSEEKKKTVEEKVSDEELKKEEKKEKDKVLIQKD